MNRPFRLSRAVVCTLPLVLLGAVDCTFEATAPGGPPALGEGKPCMILAVKFPLFDPGLGTEGDSPPESSPPSPQAQCLDKAEDIPFEWVLDKQVSGGGTDEVATVNEFNTIAALVQPGASTQCIATAHVGSSVINDTVEGEIDVFDEDFTIGMFRVTHSAPGWTQSCDFVEITLCPSPLTVDPTPIWASHATRDVADCQQGFAFVPHAGDEPIQNVIPFP